MPVLDPDIRPRRTVRRIGERCRGWIRRDDNSLSTTSRWTGCDGPVADAGRRKKTPEVIARLEVLMAHETAGDPVTGLKWTRRTTAKVAAELHSLGIDLCPRTGEDLEVQPAT